jgi:hypothetical protein
VTGTAQGLPVPEIERIAAAAQFDDMVGEQARRLASRRLAAARGALDDDPPPRGIFGRLIDRGPDLGRRSRDPEIDRLDTRPQHCQSHGSPQKKRPLGEGRRALFDRRRNSRSEPF